MGWARLSDVVNIGGSNMFVSRAETVDSDALETDGHKYRRLDEYIALRYDCDHYDTRHW